MDKTFKMFYIIVTIKVFKLVLQNSKVTTVSVNNFEKMCFPISILSCSFSINGH